MTTIASAFVELRSSSSTFATEARAQINAVLDGISAQVALGIDASRLREEVNTGMAAAVAGQKGSVPVFIDASGMRSRLVADVDAAKAGVHLEIPIEADDRFFTEEIAQIEAKVQGLRELKANIPVGIDAAHLDSQLEAEVTKAKLLADAARIRIAAGIDEGDLDADLAKVPAKARAIEDASKIEIKVDTDESPLDRLSGALGRVKGDAGGLDGVLSALKFGALAAEAGNAAAGLVSLGAGGFAAISALAPLAGLLGAIPAGLAGIGAGFGVFKLSLGGVGDALKALDKDHASAGRSAASQADAEEAAAARVKSAQDSLGDALRRQDQASEDGAKRVLAARESLSTAVEHQALVQAQGARNVEAAERTLASTQAASIQTQRDLTSAREAAARQLDDLREKVENQSLTEAEAAQRLEQARADAAKAPPPGRRTFEQSQQDARDRRAAVLAVKRAEEDLERVRTDGARSAADLQEAESKGVEGSDAVVSAKERESKAQTDVGLAIEALRLARATATREDVAAAAQVVKSQESITEAQRQNGRAQEDAARSVERASASLESAIRAQGKATDSVSSSATAAADALAALSPAGRDFALFLHSLKPDLDSLKADVSASFLPGLQVGIEKMLTLAPVVHDALVGAGAEFGSFFSRLGALAGSTSFKIDLASILGNANEFMGKLGEATLNVVSGLKDIAVAAEPMVSGLGDLAIHISEVFRNWAEGARGSGELSRFFESALDTLKQVLSIGGHLFQLLGDLGRAASPLGKSLLGDFDSLLTKLHDIASSVSGQASLRKFFDDAHAPLAEASRLVGDLLKGVVTLGGEHMGTLTTTLNTLRTDVLPVILDLLRAAAPGSEAIISVIRTVMQNKDFTAALHTAVAAFADLIVSLASNKDFINGLVTGLTTVLDIVSTVAGWITWINENVPGAGALLGTVFGTLIAIAGLKHFANIFSPLIDGAKSLIGLVGSAIKKIAELRAAQAASSAAGGAGGIAGGVGGAAGGLGAGGAGLVAEGGAGAGLAGIAGPALAAAGALTGLVIIGKQVGDSMAGNEGPIGAFRDAIGGLFGLAPEARHFANASAEVLKVLGYIATTGATSEEVVKSVATAVGADLVAASKKGEEALTAVRDNLSFTTNEFTSLSRQSGLSVDSVLRVADAMGINLKEAFAKGADGIRAVFTQLDPVTQAIGAFGKQAGITGDEAIGLADSLKVDLAGAAAQGGQAFDDAKTKIIAGADELAKKGGYASFSVAKNAGETIDTLRTIAGEADKFRTSAESAFKSQTSFIGNFFSQGPATAGAIGQFFADSVAKTKKWGDDIRTLMHSNIDKGFLREIVLAGPQAADKVAGLVQLVGDGGAGVINEAIGGQKELLKSLLDEITNQGPFVKTETGKLPDQAQEGTGEGVERNKTLMETHGINLKRFFTNGLNPPKPEDSGGALVGEAVGQTGRAVVATGKFMEDHGWHLGRFFHGGVTTPNPNTSTGLVLPVVAGTGGTVGANAGDMETHGINLKRFFHGGVTSDPQSSRNTGSWLPYWVAEGVRGSNNILDSVGKESGAYIDGGVGQGMRDNVELIKAACRSVANTIKPALGDILHFGSPSRLMRDEVGKPIVEGIAVGIRGNVSVIRAALDHVGGVIAGTSFGLPSVSMPTINVGAVEAGSAAISRATSVGTAASGLATSFAAHGAAPLYTGPVHEDHSTHLHGDIVAPDPTLVPSEITRQTRSKRWLVGASKAPDRGTR